MEKKIEKRQNGMLAPTAEPIPGLEGVRQESLIIPRVKLVQKMSAETEDGVVAGSLVNNVTGDVIAEVDKETKRAKVTVIPVLNSYSRVFFSPRNADITKIIGDKLGIPVKKVADIIGENNIICRSYDARHAAEGFAFSEGSEFNPTGKCADCPMSQWGKQRDDAPPCTDFLNVFVAVREYPSPIPMVVSFGRTSAQAGRQLLNFFYFDARREKLPPWNFAYELRTIQRETEKGSFHVFKVFPAGRATEEEVAQGAAFYELIKSAAQVEIAEEDMPPEELVENKTMPSETEDEKIDDEIPF